MHTPIEELVVFCLECEHSEFVHSDREKRGCLFSDCGCSGFDAHPRSAVVQIREPDDVSTTAHA